MLVRLLRSTLRSTEWSRLLDFVSPTFFDVLPARAAAGAARDLLASMRDAAGFRALHAEVAARLGARDVPIEVHESAPAAAADGPPRSRAARVARGDLVLRLYFEQLLGCEAALLDLRGAAFSGRRGGLAWHPARGFVRWDPAFLGAIRRMYAGFYAGDDAAFHAALGELGLDCAADLFALHFGGDGARAVRFEMARFTESFHAVFVRCREHGVRLHPDFLALGVHLAALYEHLEPLDVPLDVAAAFRSASS